MIGAWRRCRPAVLALAAAIVVCVGCSSPTPKASSAVPPPAEVDPAPHVWAALGGDETVVLDPATAAEAWTQIVLDGLPPSAQLLNLATDDATVSDVLGSQLAALQASPVAPTVATVWLGAGDSDASPSEYRTALDQVIDALQERGVGRIVVLSRTDDGVGDRAADNEAIATGQGVAFVAVEPPEGEPGSAAFQAGIAAQVAPSLSA